MTKVTSFCTVTFMKSPSIGNAVKEALIERGTFLCLSRNRHLMLKV